MWINNIRIFPSRQISSIEIRDGYIFQCGTNKFGGDGIDGMEGMLTPGLINSHEHLDFDLYDMLGSPPYMDYRDWAMDIHARHKTEIESIEGIPRRLRIMWGVVRNMLNGITAVVHHGSALQAEGLPITVVDHMQDLHSVGFEKNWKLKLNNLKRLNLPCVIHTGEGISLRAAREVDELLRSNYFSRKIIGVHGVAMDEEQAKRLGALVWCPVTNQFMLHAQPRIDPLKKHTAILFGTDSTLTSTWNIREHLRFARRLGMLNDNELLASCTTSPANVWQMKAGTITPGMEANLVISRASPDMDQMDAFYDIDPVNIELVMHKGKIVLTQDSLQADHLMEFKSAFNFGGRQYFSLIDIQSLQDEIRTCYPSVVFSHEFTPQAQAV